MRFEQTNGIGAEIPGVELSADLDWMLQSQQVSDQAVSEALVETHFQPLFQFVRAYNIANGSEQAAFTQVVDGLSWAVHHRQAYWGGASVRVWLFTHLLRQIRRSKAGRMWGKAPLRLLLCDQIGLSPSEADAVLSNKRRAALSGTSDDDLAQSRLTYSRRTLSEADRLLLERAAAAISEDQEGTDSFTIPAPDEIVHLILETSNQAGVGRVLSRNVLQAVMLGGVLLALVVFVLYRTTIEQEISARVTPPQKEVLVTWTPESDAVDATEAAAFSPAIEPAVQVVAWEVLLEPMTLGAVSNSAAETYLRLEYSGLLAMAVVLNYWDRPVDIAFLRNLLQPAPDDSVVMFYELVDYASGLGFYADFRLGGNASMVCQLVQAGFPVIAQIGVVDEDLWNGQFVVVSGCDPQSAFLMVELISLTALPSTQFTTELMGGIISYEAFERRWAHFAGAFLVVYPEAQMSFRGSAYQSALDSAGVAIEENSYEMARQQAEGLINTVQGRDLFFALFSYATALVYQRDYGTASTYFDAAFEQYDTIHPAFRPYRVMWYQTRPYWAYYYTGNYGSLVTLADRTLAESGAENALEETYYWRALGREGLGDLAGAITDLETALQKNPNFSLAQEQLERIRSR